jgi:hypothetical protein
MKQAVPKFLKVLLIELEDLQADVELLNQENNDREKNREITTYVHLENATTLHNQLSGVKKIINELQGISSNQFTSLDELEEYILKFVKKEIARLGYPEVVFNLVSKKVEKVKRYVLECR